MDHVNINVTLLCTFLLFLNNVCLSLIQNRQQLRIYTPIKTVYINYHLDLLSTKNHSIALEYEHF
jgi:hypothetical protein